MADWRALTLHQPYATGIALGLKGIETRTKPVKYRGWLAIHAAVFTPAKVRREVLGQADRGQWRSPFAGNMRIINALYHCGYAPWDANSKARDDYLRPLPLGAVVAVARLVDVVPIVHAGEERAVRRVEVFDDSLWLSEPDEEDENGEQWGEEETREVTEERPWGLYEPGRYAWLLADVIKLPEPIPAKGKQGLWKPDPELAEQLEAVARG